MEKRKKDIPTEVEIRNQGVHRSREENELGTCTRQDKIMCDDNAPFGRKLEAFGVCSHWISNNGILCCVGGSCPGNQGRVIPNSAIHLLCYYQ